MPSHTLATQGLALAGVDVTELLIDDPDILASYNEDTYTTLRGQATLLARPASELEVAALMAWANGRGVPVTIVGRQTGLAGGATPLGHQREAGTGAGSDAGSEADISKGKAASAGKQAVLALSTEQLTQLRIDVAAHQAIVGAGVLQGDLWRACAAAKGPDAPHGLLYPPDPTSRDDASLGGGVACNASGARTFRYGPTRDWVTGLRVVLASGEVLDLQRGQTTFGPDDRVTIATGNGSGPLVLQRPSYTTQPGKNAAGYHSRPGMELIDLFIGDEGTLGVITQVRVRLTQQPADRFQLLVGFANRPEALAFVQMVRELDDEHRPVAVEWVDDGALKLMALHQPQHLFFATDDLAAILVLELELRPPARPGPVGQTQADAEAQIDDEVEATLEDATGTVTQEALETLRDRLLEQWAARLEAHAPVMVLTAVTAAQIERFRQMRHAVASTVNELLTFRGVPKLGTDTRVPWEQLAGYLEWVYSRIEEAGLEAVSYGHVGDGHVHFNLIARDLAELERARKVYHLIVTEAVARGGVVSAEHGIGKIKVEYLKVQLGQQGHDEMRRLKQTLDPNDILGPGNLF